MFSGKALVEYVRVSTQEFLPLFFQTLPSVFPSGIFRSDWRPGSLQGCERKKVRSFPAIAQYDVLVFSFFQFR